MSVCKKIRAQHRKPCIGDMRWLIDIFNPVIVPPTQSTSIDYTVDKLPVTTVWSMVKTLPNVAIFDEMNTEQTVSHEFIIRYRSDVTPEFRIRYPATTGQYYKIVTLEDFENRREFLRMKCTLKGAEAVV